MLFRISAPAAIAAGAMLLFAGAASAVNLPSGSYKLHNHPDGSARPPLYGARFDELYNATNDHDIFTLDFDDITSNMRLTINAARTEIHIFGNARGGRDNGTAFANDQYLGNYHLDFLYHLGVAQSPGDDDIQVNTPDMRNSGTITTPLGTIHLTDKAMDAFAFRLGDEDDAGSPTGGPGHRGFAGISGWGWMNYLNAAGAVVPHIESTDWLFTANYEIPAPGAAALMGLGGLVMGRRRRR